MLSYYMILKHVPDDGQTPTKLKIINKTITELVWLGTHTLYKKVKELSTIQTEQDGIIITKK